MDLPQAIIWGVAIECCLRPIQIECKGQDIAAIFKVSHRWVSQFLKNNKG